MKIEKSIYLKIGNIFNSFFRGYSPESKAFFCQQTLQQSAEEFILTCFKSPSKLEKKVALAIRAAIARLGEVEPEFIRAELRFEELDPLPFWYCCGDAGFSTPNFVEAIEVELGEQFSEKQLEHATVRDPDLNVQMRIDEFIVEFSDWYSSLIQEK